MGRKNLLAGLDDGELTAVNSNSATGGAGRGSKRSRRSGHTVPSAR